MKSFFMNLKKYYFHLIREARLYRKNMRKQAVIAKYNENISWTNTLEIPIIIYDKLDNPDLPNVGRDLHTYAHHIVENYDNLADLTFFLQGNPFDHCANIINIINQLKNVEFQALTDIYRLTHKSGLPYYASLPLEDTYLQLTNNSLPELIIFISGAQFAASREKIHEHSKDFYVKIGEMAWQHSYYPHIFERLIAILIDGNNIWGVNNQHPKYSEYIQQMICGDKDLIVSL